MDTKLNWIPLFVTLDPTKSINDEGNIVQGRVVLNGNTDRVLIRVYPISANPLETQYRAEIFNDDDKNPVHAFRLCCGSMTGACRTTEEWLMPLLGEKLQHMMQLYMKLSCLMIGYNGDHQKQKMTIKIPPCDATIAITEEEKLVDYMENFPK